MPAPPPAKASGQRSALIVHPVPLVAHDLREILQERDFIVVDVHKSVAEIDPAARYAVAFLDSVELRIREAEYRRIGFDNLGRIVLLDSRFSKTGQSSFVAARVSQPFRTSDIVRVLREIGL